MLGRKPSVLDEPSLALSGPNWEAVRKGWRPGERVQHWLLDDVHFTADDPFMKPCMVAHGDRCTVKRPDSLCTVYAC